MEKYRRALVTGANGFLGSYIVDALNKKGIHVKCLVRTTSNLRWINNIKGIELANGSLNDIKSLKDAVSNVDVIYHSAALKFANSEALHKTNILGTRNLLEACKTANPEIRRFVYISSIAAMGPCTDGLPLTESNSCKPRSLYGKSKLEGEKILMEYKIPYTIVRPPVIYGPRDEDVLKVIKIVARGFKPTFKGILDCLSMMYIDDVVEATLIAAEHEKAKNQVYILSDNKTYSWNEVLDEASKILKVRTLSMNVPKWLLHFGAIVVEGTHLILGKTSPINRQKVSEVVCKWIFSGEKIKKELGFSARWTLQSGLKHTLNWYKEHKWL